ncbi:ankyrin [Favolaschia claudopus]|uniref:Ankyrin n=1 Tax=Favolaschia claudopus TaxID=2862362 RepID=A0AAV9ZLD5_9AGAR
MAEVLSIVTGILQLLDTALKVKELVKDVHKATQEKQEILDDLEVLKPLLAELRLRILASPSQRVLQGMTPSLTKFHVTLEDLTRRLQPAKDTFERLRWGFSEKKKMKEDLLTLRQFHEVVNSWMILDFWDQIDAAQRLAIIEWLSPLNFFIRQQDISRTRQPETGEWLLKDSKFKEWELATGAVLWCSGIPGAGKTVLAFKQIYIVIDGVDEHPEKEWHGLAGILAKLSKNINLLISILEIRARARDLEVYIKAQIVASPCLSQHIAANREVETKICSKLCDSVDGMFLLARLHLEALDAAPNTRALHHALETLPTDLNHTYKNILNRIEGLHDTQKEIAQSALVWVANAKRPLTAVELCEAIAIEPGTTTLNKDNIAGIQVIIHLCTGLIILDEQSSLVRMVHFTAQDYLDRIQSQKFPFAHVQITRSLFTYLNFKDIAKIVLKSHTFHPLIPFDEDECKQSEKLKSQHPLMSYCQYCLIHAQLCEKQLQDEVIEFLNLAEGYCNKLWTRDWGCHPWSYFEWPFSPSPLFVAAAANLVQSAELMISQGSKLYEMANDLETAANIGCKEMVVLLLGQGIDINTYRGRYGTALQAAASPGYESIVQILLEAGAEVNAQGGMYGSALHAAAYEGHESIVQMLLDRGAEVNVEGGGYANALASASAAYCEHENIVQMLLNRGAEVNVQGSKCTTALQAASYEGHENIVQMLLDRGADVNVENDFHTPLSAAIYERQENIVQLLLDRGAQVNAQGGQDGTALQVAAATGHEIIVQILLNRGAVVNAQGGQYGTALQAAASQGHETIVHMLLERDAEVNAQGGFRGTALHAAACNGHESVVHLLLHKGAEVNVEAGTYGTALQAAAYKGSESIVQLLLDRGAHVNTQGEVNAQGGKYGTALQAAVHSGHESIVQMFFNRGAEVNAQGGKYGTALQAAASGGSKNIVQLLLDRGADVNAQGGYYGTAMQAAAYEGHETIVQMLLHIGADVNAQRGYFGTALQGAAYGGHETIVEMLLDRGAEVNAVGGEYRTALQAAAHSGHESIVQMLFNRGAEVNAQGGKYGTALQAVASGGSKNIVQLLLDRGADGAAYGGHETIVEMLLDRGAEVNAVGGEYRTALQAARVWGHPIVEKILVASGAQECI